MTIFSKHDHEFRSYCEECGKGKLGQGGQGLIALCLFLPFILFSGWAGPLADRYSKRSIAVNDEM